MSAETLWNPDTRLLITRLHGSITHDDVQHWSATLDAARSGIAPDTRFRMIADFHGYEPADLQAHKAMRVILPFTLAQYGFRTALLDLFDPAEVPFTIDAGRRCRAVAHIHHDAGKMAEYDRRLGRANERFFTDFSAAVAWISVIDL